MLLGRMLVLVRVPSAVLAACAAWIVAKPRPAIVGNAALGLIGQYALIDGQEGVGCVGGGRVFAVTADHLFNEL